VVLAAIILLSTFQAYGCQPLITPATTLYPELPSTVPLGYTNVANSIYQRAVVGFAYGHITAGLIAADDFTSNLLMGVADSNFRIMHVVKYNPLDTLREPQSYSYFIIHVPGKAGVFDERAAIRTPDIIAEAVANSSTIYSNGESYILLHYHQPNS
jgi:hypothetical protein